MKISDRQLQSVIAAYHKRLDGVTADARTGALPRAATRTDRVELSPDAQELARLTQMARQMPEVREDLIRQLAEALREGTYRVPAREVADKMVARYLADRLQ